MHLVLGVEISSIFQRTFNSFTIPVASWDLEILLLTHKLEFQTLRALFGNLWAVLSWEKLFILFFFFLRYWFPIKLVLPLVDGLTSIRNLIVNQRVIFSQTDSKDVKVQVPAYVVHYPVNSTVETSCWLFYYRQIMWPSSYKRCSKH